MAQTHPSFAALTSFETLDYASADERFEFDLTDDDPPEGFNIALSDVFGEDPQEIFVHEGDVSIAGDVRIGANGDYAGVYVIDGDLEVNGLLQFVQVDGGAVLLVTGSLRATHLSVEQEAQLWVGKHVAVEGYILAGVSDAGGLAVKGETHAEALIVTDRESLGFGTEPQARILQRTMLAAPFNSELDHEALVQAVREGRLELP